MSALSDLKWNLERVRLNKNGKCLTYIVNAKGERIAVSKQRTTTDVAEILAEKYAEKYLSEQPGRD